MSKARDYYEEYMLDLLEGLTEREKEIKVMTQNFIDASMCYSNKLYRPEEKDVELDDDIVGRHRRFNIVYEQERRKSLNLVWWDLNTFPPSKQSDHFFAIKQWLQWRTGYVNPVEFYVYGDMNKFGRYFSDDISREGVTFYHVAPQDCKGAPGGVEGGTCFYAMFRDIAISTLNHPPPTNYLIISGDHRFKDVGITLEKESFGCTMARPSSILPCTSHSDLPKIRAKEVIWVDIAKEW